MSLYKQHIIFDNQDARSALKALEALPENSSRTLFVLNVDSKLVGVITDGDIRRGLLDGSEISDPATRFMNTQFKYLKDANYSVDEIKKFKKSDIFLIPIVSSNFELVDVVDQVEHDLAQQHVLQRRLRPRALVLRVVAVQRLDEVAVGRVEVLVLGMEHPRLHIQVRLE